MPSALNLSISAAAIFASVAFAQVPIQVQREEALKAEMREAEQLAKTFRAAADKVNNDQWIGTMYNEVDAEAHTCYSLGKLMGIDHAVKGLRFSRTPQHARTADEAQDVRIKAQSMSNFVDAAKTALATGPDQRAIAWNLDCAPSLGNFVPSKSHASFFEVMDKGRGVKILGAIEAGFTRRLSDALAQAPKATFVALGSGGGSVEEALAAGRLIRSRKLNTVVWNNCYSACPMVFMGGVERLVYAPYPSLGFHQIYTDAGALPPTSPVYARVANYVREMGADDQFFVAAMLRARPDQMNTLSGSSEQLCRSRVVTWAQRSCVPGLPK